MEFQNFASRETTTTISELLGTQSGAALYQLRVVRDALDAAARALDTPAHLDTAIQDLVTRLTRAADADIARIRDEAAMALDAMRGELRTQQAQHDAIAAVLAKTETEAATLRADLQTAYDRAEAAEHDLMITVDAHAELETNFRKVESDCKQEQDTRERIEAELSQAHTTIQQLLADVEQLRGKIEQQTGETAALRSELARAAEVYRQRDALTTELNLSLARVKALEGDLAEERRTRDQLDAAIHASRTRIQALQNDLVKAKEIREHRDALQAQLNASSTRLRALETDLATTNQIREHRDALAAQIDTSSTRIRSLENELARATEVREQRDALAAQLEIAGARIRHLEGDIARVNEIREQRDTLAARLDAGTTRIRILETDLARSNDIREHRDLLLGQLDEAGDRIRMLESELNAAREVREQRDSAAVADAGSARLEALEKEVATARETREERDRFAITLQQTGARLRTLENELAAAREVRDERDRFAVQLEKANFQVHALARELASARDVLAKGPAAQSAVESGTRASTESLRAEIDRMASLFDVSARAVSDLAAATSSTGLLTELARRLALHFSRVAIFRLKGNHLEGEHQVGLEESTTFTKVVIPTSVDSIVTRSITTGEVQTVEGEDASIRSGMPFGGSPGLAIAVPIVLQGTSLGVVYADDSRAGDTKRGHASHATSVGFARLLVGQVVVLLMRHTHELKALAELSQYATTLLQEAKEMYAADTQAGKNTDLVRSRLKANIDCACQLYTYRAAMEGTAAAALLDEQIVAEMQESTPFASDLASVVAEMAKNDLEITAEAS